MNSLRSRGPDEPAFASRDAVVAWLILAITVTVVLVVFWPGRISIDTLNEITEASTGELTNRSAPLLLALWHAFWGLGFGPAAVLVVQVACFVIGAYLVLRAAFRPVGAAAVTAFVVAWPVVLGNLGSLQRDTWFAALLLLTFGILVRATQREWPVRGRYLALAVLAAWLALAARQNAAPAVVIACVVIAWLWLAHRREGGPAPKPTRGGGRAIAAAVGGGVALTLALVATQFGATKLLGLTNVHPETPLYIYDLAAISTRERENLFPSDLMPERGIGPIDRTYDPDSMLKFLFPAEETISPRFSQAVGFPDVGDAAASSLRRAWTDAVTDHPGTYAAARSALMLRQLGLTRAGVSVYSPNAADNGGWPFQFPDLYDRAIDYLDAFTDPDPDFYGHPGGGVLFRVWIYLLVAAAAAAIFLRRSRPPPLVVVGALALAALTYQFGYLFVALGTRFRYEFPSAVIGMLAAAILLHFAWGRWRASRGADAATDPGS